MFGNILILCIIITHKLANNVFYYTYFTTCIVNNMHNKPLFTAEVKPQSYPLQINNKKDKFSKM